MSVGTSMISLDKSNITLGYDANLQKIKNNILNYTSTNRQRSQELIKSVKAKINKENLYQSLKRDLEYHIITNKNFKAYKKYVDKVSGYYEKNKKDIENYCVMHKDNNKLNNLFLYFTIYFHHYKILHSHKPLHHHQILSNHRLLLPVRGAGIKY